MAHDVRFEVPKVQLANLDVVFRISRNKARLGKLEVSKDGIWWKPRGKQRTNKVKWDELTKLVLSR